MPEDLILLVPECKKDILLAKGVIIKTKEEIELLRNSNRILSETLALVGELLKPGVTGKQLDVKAEEYIRDNGGIPSFLGYQGFPGSLCISINEAVVHGIPSDYVIKDKDIVSVDCGVYIDGFHGDCAYTFAVGDVDEDVMDLLRVTRDSLHLGIKKAVAGARTGDIGYAIQKYAEYSKGYGIVRELVGHGVGRDLHEKPEVPNYGKRGRGVLLKEGMTFAIEPMVNLGTRKIDVLSDGWTVVTRDGKVSAHYEHSVAINNGVADVLSNHTIVEESIKKNVNIKEL